MYPHTCSQSIDDRWYVVHCKPGKEFLAEAALQENLDLQTYLPTVLSPVRGTIRKVPFFPGYLFLSAAPPQMQLTRIRSMPGVLRVLDFGDGPQAVPKLVVSAIQERLETLNNNGGLPAHNFKPGETITLKSGPFRGLQAVFLGPLSPGARVKVLLEFLGRLNEVKVDLENLTRSDDRPAHNGRRGTRGHGRVINNGNHV
ncbi:MAG TPA: transcription termination/antitermination NusG family protein [Chloroflexia bacterium]|nr:transcription termination/antitermination NusG family protein [Chloroflexia bacterium]